MRIDSHQHFWKISRGDYHWMSPSLRVLYRNYLPADLVPILEQFQFDKTIVVQAAQTVAETDFLLHLAESNDFIAGVVGWLDLDSDGFEKDFERYRAFPKFAGVRPMIHDLPDDDWICRPQVLKNLRHIALEQFPIDLLIHVRHLAHVLRMLKMIPNMWAVIDHISKPEIKAHKLQPWKSLITEAAQYPNVFCKLSGMITEADHDSWNAEDLRPYVEHVIQSFGWDRIMYGSDWPVCLLAGDYGKMYRALHTVVSPSLDPKREAKLFGENAARFYHL